MQITEPVTLLTDYFLSAQAFYLGYRCLSTGKNGHSRATRLWGLALLMLSLGAFVGGTAHGFKLYLGTGGHAIVWKLTVYSIGLCTFFMLAGTTLGSVGKVAQRVILTFAVSQLAVYAIWMATHNDFIYVVYDYVPAMLIIIVLQAILYVKRKQVSAIWLSSGIFVSLAAAGIQISGFDIHKYLNHNDIYHLVQMVGVYLLYRGAVLLQDI